ncbi:phosphotransferase enzyme family protein [Actinopolymorpha pittospori]
MIGSEAIAEQAAEVFRLGPVVARPAAVGEAWSNQVFRVLTRSGRYAVKVLTTTSREALSTGAAVESAAAATGTIPMPTPVAAADGTWFAEIETDHGPRLVRCHRWVDGTPCSAAPPSPAIAREVGRSLGILHALRLDGGDSSRLPPVDLDRWHRAAADASRSDLSWAHQVSSLTPLVEEVADQVERLRQARLPLRLSHNDLDPKNAVVLPDGRVAITDWDYAGPVLPDVELVVAATSFAGGDGCADVDLVRHFVTAYRDAGGDATPVDPDRTVVEAGKIDWMLRNIEGALHPVPGDDAPFRHQTAQELIASFADSIVWLRTWATTIRDL